MKMLTFCLLLLAAAPAPAHNHPKGTTVAAAADSTTINALSLAKALTAFVNEQARIGGGMYTIFDPVKKKPLALSLVKVHDDKLCYLGNDAYFACADFKDPKGREYDLDLFMQGRDVPSLKPTRVLLHKEQGKLRFDWKAENGVWSMVPVKGSQAEMYAPEPLPTATPTPAPSPTLTATPVQEKGKK